MFLESQFLTEEREEETSSAELQAAKASAPVRPVSARTFRAASQTEVHVYSNLLYGEARGAAGPVKPSILTASGNASDASRSGARSLSLGAGEGPPPPTSVAFKGALSLATRGATPQPAPSTIAGAQGGFVTPAQRSGGPITLSLPTFATQARPPTAQDKGGAGLSSSSKPAGPTDGSTPAAAVVPAAASAQGNFAAGASVPIPNTTQSWSATASAPSAPTEVAATHAIHTNHRSSFTIPSAANHMVQPAHPGAQVSTIPDRARNDSTASQANAEGAVAAMAPAPGPSGAGPVVCKVDVTNLRAFAHMPGPRAAVVQCYIIRDLSEGKRFPKYLLFLEDGDRFLLAAKRRKGSKTSNYLISTDRNDPQREGASYLGKVRSNIVGTEFNVYDDGYNPAKKPDRGEHMPRRELGVVQYERNVLGSKGPRNMTVLVPRPELTEAQIPDPASTKEGNWLVDAAKLKDSRVLKFVSNPPRWNDKLNAFCLNFHGRVTQASVKNFQLVAEDLSDLVVMQFGKVAKDKFTMDFQYPMTAIQAFGICLSSFDSKLACE